ncbi:aromatic ring-hydroxylating dioxygenase subunit alpha [Sphaerisporangium sp. NPDC088356]|uniref:aromatic ring-hydroxylating oxygenase subunit alpha n=1 Tax=Sphaerisporangium sp. NPDC088356 TaxID=3154871 RepID=UPI0034460D06
MTEVLSRPTANVVQALVQQIHEQAALPLEESRPLPTRAYWDPEYYEYELEHIFRKDWICIARVEEVPDKGSYRAIDLAGEPLMVVRGNDDQVRVFSRVCRHRYADLMGGERSEEERISGCVARFECPYHAWIYRLDGSLLSAPEMSARPGFDRAAHGLREIRSEIWQGFVFVNLDADTDIPFDMSLVAETQGGYDLTDWQIASVIDWGESKVNWKIVVENFLEVYHHIGIHKNVLQPLWRLGRCEQGHHTGSDFYYARMMAGPDVAIGEEDGHLLHPLFLPAKTGLSAFERSHTLLLSKFPAYLCAPGPDITFWFRSLPTGPETHRLEIHFLVPNEHLGAEDFEAKIQEATEFLRVVQTQDASVNEAVQASARSKYATGGVLQAHEQPLWQLQKYLASRLPA